MPSEDVCNSAPDTSHQMVQTSPDASPGQTVQTSAPSNTVPTETLFDAVAQSPDVQLCEQFVQQTCGCDLAKGGPCSDLFSLEHYIILRGHCSFLTHDELDLTLLGTIMSTVNMGDNIHDGHHRPAKRKRVTMTYMHQGHEVCKRTFLFLYGIGKKRLMAVKNKWS